MTLTVRSATDTNKFYFVEFNTETNQATDCGCKDHHFRPGRVGGCKHIAEVTTQVARALTFAQLRQQYDIRGEAQRTARREAYLRYELSIGVL